MNPEFWVWGEMNRQGIHRHKQNLWTIQCHMFNTKLRNMLYYSGENQVKAILQQKIQSIASTQNKGYSRGGKEEVDYKTDFKKRR
jgi:hypothetical protein